MIEEDLEKLVSKGEGLTLEFKRCSGQVEHDVFESVCAFLNRFGGDLLLGVEDNGTICGIAPETAKSLRNNIANAANNPNLFDPVALLDPQVLGFGDKCIIKVHVPASADVHKFKGVVYDREGDADVRVRATQQIAAMYLRKQSIFTERRVFPYVSKADLRLDLLARLRTRAQNRLPYGQRHPWLDMDDDALLRSARLFGTDRATGKSGFNLAAVVLLGTDEVIGDVCPVFGTDALLRVRDTDRYDDREIVATNLVESYDRLLAFAAKHLPDPFFLEGTERISLRDIIVREMIANTLSHREFTSSRPARFVIEGGRMFTENACRASQGGVVAPSQLEPDPKNPIIAAFFREIGFADQLGSGVLKLMKYARHYGGSDPVFEDGDIFRVSVSLDALAMNPQVGNASGSIRKNFKAASLQNIKESGLKSGKSDLDQSRDLDHVASELEKRILEEIAKDGGITYSRLANICGCSVPTIQRRLRLLHSAGIIRRVGPDKGGQWEVLANIPD